VPGGDIGSPSGDVLQEEMASASFNTKTPFSTPLVILYTVLFVQSLHRTISYLRFSIYFLLLM